MTISIFESNITLQNSNSEISLSQNKLELYNVEFSINEIAMNITIEIYDFLGNLNSTLANITEPFKFTLKYGSYSKIVFSDSNNYNFFLTTQIIQCGNNNDFSELLLQQKLSVEYLNRIGLAKASQLPQNLTSSGNLSIALSENDIGNIPIEIAANNIGNIPIVIAANTLGNLPIEIAANSLGNLPISIDATNITGNIPIEIAANSIGNIPIVIAANTLGNLPITLAANTIGNLTIDIAAQSVGNLNVNSYIQSAKISGNGFNANITTTGTAQQLITTSTIVQHFTIRNNGSNIMYIGTSADQARYIFPNGFYWFDCNPSEYTDISTWYVQGTAGDNFIVNYED